MRGWWLAGMLATLCACGGAPAAREPQSVPAAAPARPPDEQRRFPLADQTSMRLIEDHVLGKDFARRKRCGIQAERKTYQQFLVHAKIPEAAALLMFNYKSACARQYLPHMGGYFGMDAATPVFRFKGRVPGRVCGLPEKGGPTRPQLRHRLNYFSGATRTNCFPVFSPCNIPMNARGAFSIPSTNCSRNFSLPCFNHAASCLRPSA